VDNKQQTSIEETKKSDEVIGLCSTSDIKQEREN
jgi:hypothetical protein